MFYTIYEIINLIDGKVYIGKHQTKDLNDGYMGSGKFIKRAIAKYGIENFRKEILFQFDNEVDMNVKEAELVTKEFCLREDTYNLCVGGNGGFSYINLNQIRNGFEKTMADEHVKSKTLIAGQIGRQTQACLWQTDSEWVSNISKKKSLSLKETFKDGHHWQGKQHSEETKQKMRKPKNQGDKNSQFGTMWITNGQENKKIKKDIDIIPEGWYKGRKIIIRV